MFGCAVAAGLLVGGTQAHAQASPALGQSEVEQPAEVGPAISGTNILLVIADDLGVDQLGVYGEGENVPPTPHINSLGQDGVLFRSAWANPMCSPTRASLLTGRHAFRHRVGAPVPPQSGAETPGLALSEVTIAEVLQASGYATGFFGKWHISNTVTGDTVAPNLQGFDHFAGSLGGALFTYTNWTKVVNGEVSGATRYATTDTVNDAIAWIREQRNDPWFAVVSFNAPHDPFHAPPQDLHTYDLDGLNPQSTPRPFYKAMVQALDTELGRLLDSLGDWEDDTTIIFIGDNGTPRGIAEAPFDPTRAKSTPFEGGVNVPLIIAGDSVDDNGRCNEIVQVLDLFATIADIADVNYRDFVPGNVTVDSVSLMPYLDRPDRRGLRQSVFTELFANGDPSRSDAAIRDDRYKLVLFQNVLRFYDLEADPFENRDLLPVNRLSRPQREAYDDLYEEAVRLRTSR